MANIFRKMAEKWREMSDEVRERKEFQKLVNDKTKPRRRAAYLKEKMRQAVEEGYMIAQQEKLSKMNKKRTLSEFGINEKEIEEIDIKQIKPISKKEQFGSLTKSQGDLLKPTIDWGWDSQSKYLGENKLNTKEKKNGN